MKSIFAALALTLTFTVSGCAVYTPSGAVVIDPVRVPSGGNGQFCPPGQAKKGNC